MSQSTVITRLLLLSADPMHASTCLYITSDGSVRERRQCDAAHALPVEPGSRDLLAVPSEALRLQWLDLPAHSEAQALAAARLLLQEHVAAPLDGLHVAVGSASNGDTRRLVGVVDEACMQQWLQRAAAMGLQAHAVVPDCLLLDAPDGDGVQACERDGLLLVRGQALAFATESALARQVIGERPLHRLHADACEARFAANTQAALALDLLQGTHALRDERAPKQRRRLLYLAALALLSPLLLLGAQAIYHATSARWLGHRADTLAAQYQPRLTARTLPAHYRQRIAADLLAVHSSRLFDALQSLPGTRVDSLEFTPDTGVRLGLLHPDEQALETLRGLLAENGLDAVALDSQPVESGLRSLIAVEPMQ